MKKIKKHNIYFHNDCTTKQIESWIKTNIDQFESVWPLLTNIVNEFEIELVFLSDNSVAEHLEIEMINVIHPFEIKPVDDKSNKAAIDMQVEADVAYFEKKAS